MPIHMRESWRLDDDKLAADIVVFEHEPGLSISASVDGIFRSIAITFRPGHLRHIMELVDRFHEAIARKVTDPKVASTGTPLASSGREPRSTVDLVAFTERALTPPRSVIPAETRQPHAGGVADI